MEAVGSGYSISLLSFAQLRHAVWWKTISWKGWHWKTKTVDRISRLQWMTCRLEYNLRCQDWQVPVILPSHGRNEECHRTSGSTFQIGTPASLCGIWKWLTFQLSIPQQWWLAWDDPNFKSTDFNSPLLLKQHANPFHFEEVEVFGGLKFTPKTMGLFQHCVAPKHWHGHAPQRMVYQKGNSKWCRSCQPSKRFRGRPLLVERA